MHTLKDIEIAISKYAYLENYDIVKLICAFCLTCKLPTNPLWLFIAAGSSAGKTLMIELFEKVPGFTQIDNMTTNSLQSGMKRTDRSASLLKRLPDYAFIVFKDFTSMMSKNPEVFAEIMGQMRTLFDGSMVKLTGGQEEEQKFNGKVSMLGAGTGVLYSKNDQFADMGQRMVIYNFEPADDYAISKFKKQHRKDDRKAKKEILQTMFKEYVASITVPDKFENLPDIDDQTWDDLTDVAHLATTARSPVTRNKYGQKNEVLDKGFKESFTRMFDQLCVTAYGLILQNPDGKITQGDRKLLYKLALDCVDPKKKAVLRALTRFSSGGGPEEIATEIGFTKGSAEQFTEDLMIHGMVTRERVPYHSGHKTIYKIVPKYRDIMARFENIEVEQREVPGEESIPLPEAPDEGVSLEDTAQLATLFKE